MIAFLCVGLLALTQADRDQPADETDAVVTIGSTTERAFPEISLDFVVKNSRDEPILDASRDDFRVTESGQDVEITRFSSPISREYKPTTVVLVLDRSGSMNKEDRITGLKSAVRSFLENQPEGSRVAVIAFGSEVKLLCPFTTDADLIRESVDALQADGYTRYYDAVDMALNLLSDETGRRAILAMTDGEDNQSVRADLQSTIRHAQKEGLPIHTMALGSEQEIRADDLRMLSSQTRGQAFSTRKASGLKSIFEEIARSLSQSYSLTYRSDRPLPDGTLRPIRIYFRKNVQAAQAQVYIPGMVVPAPGWSGLFLLMVAGLIGLGAVKGRTSRRNPA